MSKLTSVSIEITADNKGAMRGIKQTKDGIKGLDDQVDKNGDTLKASAMKWAKWGAAAAAAAAAATAAIVKEGLRATRELRNLSQAANVTLNEFQQMAFAAKSVGIEQEKLGDILKDMNDRVGDFIATGAGPMADFFENIAPKVGVTADQFRNLSGKDALQLYVSSLEKANLNQQEMTFYMEAIASDSTRLLPLLKDNGAAMAEQAEAAAALGIGLSEIDAEQAEEAQQSLDRLGSVISDKVMEAAAALAPVVIAVSDAITQLIGAESEEEKQLRLTTAAIKDQEEALRGLSEEKKEVAAANLGKIIQDVGATVVRLTREYEAAKKAAEELNNTSQTGEGVREQFQVAKRLKDQLDFVSARFATLQEQQRILLGKDKEPDQLQDLSEFEAAAEKRKQLASELAVLEAQGAQQRLDAQSLAMASELEKLEAHYIAKRELLMNDLALTGQIDEDGRIKTDEGRALELQLRTQFEEEKTRIAQEGKEQRKKLIDQETMDSINSALAMGQGLLLIGEEMGSKSEKQQKKWRIRSAKINTAAGIMLAYGSSTNIYEAIAKAAAVAIQGKRQIDAIRSASSAPTTPAAAPVAQPPAQAQQTNRVIDVNIVGQGLLSADQVRGLIGQINEQAGDGLTINV